MGNVGFIGKSIDVTYEVIVFYLKTKVRVFYSVFEDPPKSTLKYEKKLVCGLLASLGKYACICQLCILK
jgi:hypothetical protein